MNKWKESIKVEEANKKIEEDRLNKKRIVRNAKNCMARNIEDDQR